MKVAVIEDDEHKRRQLISFLKDEFSLYQVNVAKSYSSGLKIIRNWEPDLILLDMSLPNYDGEFSSTEGGKFRSYGGRDLLHQIARRKIPTKVVVVTQYDTFSSEDNAKTLDTLTGELRTDFGPYFLDAIYYSASQDDWKLALRPFLEVSL